jgi:hypothetical protein
LHLVALSKAAAAGDAVARARALELGEALAVLSSWDEGTDLVLYYKYMLELQGEDAYKLHFNATDELSSSQRAWAKSQFEQFNAWYASWSQQPDPHKP